MAILSSSDYPAIRQALDITFDENYLPDATIALPIYLGAAESEIVRRDPQAASRTGAAGIHIKNAVILLTASYLAPAIQSMHAETFGTYTYTHDTTNWQEKAEQLAARSEQELQSAMGNLPAPARPSFFTVARGGRGA